LKRHCLPSRRKKKGVRAEGQRKTAWHFRVVRQVRGMDDRRQRLHIFLDFFHFHFHFSCIYLGEDNWLKATSEWQALLAAEEISIEVPGKSGRVFDVSLMNSYLVFPPIPPMHWFNLPAIYIGLQLPALIAAIKCCRCEPQNEILASESRQLASPAKTNLPKCLWFLWSKECAR